MSENGLPYTLNAEEKASKVMVYTLANLVWGDLITKEMVRVGTYLRVIKPDYISLYVARALSLQEGGPERAVSFAEIHLSANQILAFHLLPPASEPRDYDSAETNRKMVPITVMVGPFRFEGLVRMSTMADLSKYMEISREVYISLYEVEVSLPGMPSLRGVRADTVLVRRESALFAARQP